MDSSLLDVRVHDTGVAGVVAVRGEIDMANSAILRQAVADEMRNAATSGRTTVIVDLSAVSFMDTSGLRVLIIANQAGTARLRLVVATSGITRLLAITGMDRIFEIHPTADAALAAGS